MYILRKICEIGSFEVRIISPCGTFCQFGEGTIPCPSHHLFRQGVQLNNSANVSNHFKSEGGWGCWGTTRIAWPKKTFQMRQHLLIPSCQSVSESLMFFGQRIYGSFRVIFITFPSPYQRPIRFELFRWQISMRKNFPDKVRKFFLQNVGKLFL